MKDLLFRLGDRLSAVADFVRSGARLADVGTDHAYLPIYLINAGIINQAIAVDIRENPLKKANINIKKNNLSDKVITFISDGLSKIQPDSVDDIVIAGMGGELIVEILNQAAWVKNPHYNLILQPMTRPEALRKYLCQNGFIIKKEKAVCEGDKLYTIINAVYPKQTAFISDCNIYIGALTENSDENAVAFLQKTARSLRNSYKGAVAEKNQERASEIYKTVSEICDLIGENIDDYCQRD